MPSHTEAEKKKRKLPPVKKGKAPKPPKKPKKK